MMLSIIHSGKCTFSKSASCRKNMKNFIYPTSGYVTSFMHETKYCIILRVRNISLTKNISRKIFCWSDKKNMASRKFDFEKIRQERIAKAKAKSGQKTETKIISSKEFEKIRQERIARANAKLQEQEA